MSRPFYESTSDVANETSVAKSVGAATMSTMKKNPKAYPIDWCAYKGERIKAWVEIKCRKNPKDQYPDLMLSYNKIMHGKHYAETSKSDFVLVVKWTEGIFWWKCPNDVSTYKVGNGGRVDRGDKQDMEPVIYIPTSEFKPLLGDNN